ncbi:spore germination protein [Neobacillus sp. PS3-12]|jgi:spore germination protein PF|uniref:spore germination protein n=1 Tax=Neobacillus sp. PS3-12 TaxID=3070677 RepID=UPI0027E053CF|nr:spore germination protein [Neobacillus sp. PS3-12]WML51152.1 spore germination protein [Neobacillus sp. PS3-12]
MEGFIGGPLIIDTVGGQANVNFGGTLYLSPKNISKTAAGAGGGHTNVIGFGISAPSSTNTIDTNVAAQPVILDN